MIKEVKSGEKILALVVTKNLQTDSISFVTPPTYPIQIGLLQHKGGKTVPLHFHNDFKYEVSTTHEILYVERGEMTVTITDNQWKEIFKDTLTSGDLVLLMDGGHTVTFSEDARVWEFKQGPYPGDALAKVFKDNWEGNIPENKLCNPIKS